MMSGPHAGPGRDAGPVVRVTDQKRLHRCPRSVIRTSGLGKAGSMCGPLARAALQQAALDEWFAQRALFLAL